MPIKYKPAQGPEIAARAGAAAGAAEKAKTEQRIDLQLEAEERAKTWEITKMELESQRRFTNWQREQQVEDEKWLRAKEWQIEKAELASRMDFQREEEERQRKLSELDAQEKAVDKTVEKLGINDTLKQKKFELWRQRLAVQTGTTPGHYRPPKTELHPYSNRRRELAAIVGEELAGWMSLPELEAEAIKLQMGGEAPVTTTPPSPGEMPTVVTDADYDALPSGTEFADGEGKRWRKP